MTFRTSSAWEDFAYGVERVFSPDRWCLVGEAAAFADPFYSPGSDMIGYGNVFAGDLVARDLEGEDIGDRLDYFNELYFRIFEWCCHAQKTSTPFTVTQRYCSQSSCSIPR